MLLLGCRSLTRVSYSCWEYTRATATSDSSCGSCVCLLSLWTLTRGTEGEHVSELPIGPLIVLNLQRARVHSTQYKYLQRCYHIQCSISVHQQGGRVCEHNESVGERQRGLRAHMMVTRFAWMAHMLASSNRLTRNISIPSWRAIIADA